MSTEEKQPVSILIDFRNEMTFLFTYLAQIYTVVFLSIITFENNPDNFTVLHILICGNF